MSYPEAINLPFNGEMIKEHYRPVKPGEPGPTGPGFWLVLQGNALVLAEDGGALTLPEGERPVWLSSCGEPLCIGTWHGLPLRVLALGRGVALPSPFVAEPFNAMEERIDDRIMTLGGLGQQILNWERNSRLCCRCAEKAAPIPGTWGKRCSSCGYEHYPHIHPCAIVLVRRGNEFLLARKPEWPAGRYSLVAGFVDFGESLEECAQREVREETGVEITNIRYVGSQNWPFPSQLMAGFVADYAGGEIRVDREELEDARWFRIGDLPASLPGKRSIARWIIDEFALGSRR